MILSKAQNMSPYSPIIKICGIKNSEILSATISAGANMVGFVHFAESPRHLELSEIENLIKLSNGRIKTTILLVNPDGELIEKTVRLKPDYIQLHGKESAKEIKTIREKYKIGIIKALPISTFDDLAQIKQYDNLVDLIILDAKPPKNSANPGGLGVSFDWNILTKLDKSQKYLLSGGLNVKNVKRAVSLLKPYGLDVSSGVESIRGVKDKNLIKEFIKAAREAAR